MKLKLYHYWRSSCSWRVRWALALKQLECDLVAVDLTKNEQKSDEHLRRNPLGSVPVLEITDDFGVKFLSESVAIIEWLEETFPKHNLFPKDGFLKALVRQLTEIINADTHALHAPKAQRHHSEDPEKQTTWARHWIENGLYAYEKIASKTAAQFSVGDQITMADLCLVPLCHSALRYNVDLTQFSTVKSIYENALKTESCQKSHPDRFKPVGG